MAARFARSGFTSSFGKMGPVINGLKLPTEIHERYVDKARQAGIPLREFLRERLVISEVGIEAVNRANEERVISIAGLVQKR